MGSFKTFLFESEVNELNSEIDSFYLLLDEGMTDSIKTGIKFLGALSYPILKDVYEPLVDKIIANGGLEKKENIKNKLSEIKNRLLMLINKDMVFKDTYKRIFEPLVGKLSAKLKSNEEMLEKFKDYMTKESEIAQGYELDLRNYFASILSAKERKALRDATIRLQPVIGKNVQDRRLYDIFSRLPVEQK
jgi:hypothetical protein